MYKYSVILGNLGNTCDRFCKGYKDNPSTEEMLAEAVKIPYVEGIELVGTWDIRPDNVKDMKQRMQDYGKTCVSIIPDVFTDKIYSKGTITNNDPAIRRKALDYLRKIGEIALEMDCKLVNMWMAQDGYDYLLSTDYDQKRDWLCEGTAALANPRSLATSLSTPAWQILFLQPKRRGATTSVSALTPGIVSMPARTQLRLSCSRNVQATNFSICISTITMVAGMMT